MGYLNWFYLRCWLFFFWEIVICRSKSHRIRSRRQKQAAILFICAYITFNMCVWRILDLHFHFYSRNNIMLVEVFCTLACNRKLCIRFNRNFKKYWWHQDVIYLGLVYTEKYIVVCPRYFCTVIEILQLLIQPHTSGFFSRKIFIWLYKNYAAETFSQSCA